MEEKIILGVAALVIVVVSLVFWALRDAAAIWRLDQRVKSLEARLAKLEQQ